MKKILSFLAAMLFCCCSADSEMKAQNMEQKMYITIGGQTQSVTLVNNTATQELVAALLVFLEVVGLQVLLIGFLRSIDFEDANLA